MSTTTLTTTTTTTAPTTTTLINTSKYQSRLELLTSGYSYEALKKEIKVPIAILKLIERSHSGRTDEHPELMFEVVYDGAPVEIQVWIDKPINNILPLNKYEIDYNSTATTPNPVSNILFTQTSFKNVKLFDHGNYCISFIELSKTYPWSGFNFTDHGILTVKGYDTKNNIIVHKQGNIDINLEYHKSYYPFEPLQSLSLKYFDNNTKYNIGQWNNIMKKIINDVPSVTSQRLFYFIYQCYSINADECITGLDVIKFVSTERIKSGHEFETIQQAILLKLQE